MARIYQRQQEAPEVVYYSPPRKLKNSVASFASDGRGSDFPAEDSNIPDLFATTESPKLKFLFSVQFYPRSEAISLVDNGADNMDDLIFALKRATRPNITATYQPVNMYNYRTQILTKIEYGSSPATLTFYDDTSNRSLDIIIQYLQTVSPVFSKTIEDASSMGDDASASVGDSGAAFGPFAAIRVAHHSINPDDPNKMQSVYYDYINPKIVSVNLDDLDMTASEVTNVEFSFNYDSVSITTPQSTASNAGGTVSVGNIQSDVGIS